MAPSSASFSAVSPDRTPLERLLEALNHRRRRELLYLLQDTGAIDVESVVRCMAASELDAPPPEISDDVLLDVNIALHHNHLPRLEELGLVEFDRRSEMLRLHITNDDQAALLSTVRELDEVTVAPFKGNCD